MATAFSLTTTTSPGCTRGATYSRATSTMSSVAEITLVRTGIRRYTCSLTLISSCLPGLASIANLPSIFFAPFYSGKKPPQLILYMGLYVHSLSIGANQGGMAALGDPPHHEGRD